MAELTTLARPYAKAAFEYAREANDMASWSSGLSVAAAVSQEAPVAKFLDSPTLTTEQKASLLNDVCGEAVSASLKAFMVILADNKRLALLPSVHHLFEQLKAQQEKFADVYVTSAFALDDGVEKSLSDKLKAVLNNDVSISTTVDSSLLGGVIIRTGDTVIDGSVKGRLNKLAETLGA